VACTASRTITQEDLDAGSIINTANASATDPAGQPVDAQPASATVTALQRPQIALAKTADKTSFDAIGQVIHYTLVATNLGNVTLTGVSIADPTAGTLSCEPAQPATLAVNGTITCTGSHTVAQGDLDAGKVDNTAAVSGSGPQGQPVSASATRSVPAAQTLDLALAKTADRASYDTVGQVINYTLVASNLSNVTLHDVGIDDPTLGALSCTPALPAMLAPNATVTCTGSYTVAQADLDAGSVRNTAAASGMSPQDQPVASAPASVTIPAVQRPHITLTKSASPTTYDTVGQAIQYTLVATNDGNVALTSVAIGDPKLGTLSCAPAQPATLAPGQSLTCTGSRTVNADDLINRKIENTASATGRGPLGQPVFASASAIATATVACAVQSSIVANFNGTAIAAGNTIWFNSVVTTTGRNTAQTTKVQFVNAAIRFTAGGVAYTLPVPDGVIVYSPAATQATTTVGADGRWFTTVPASYTGNVFLAGLAYQVPTSLPGSIKNVTWSGTFVTPSSGINMSWKWAAAVYTSFATDASLIGVKPIDATSGNPYPNSDKAGTPENYKQYVTGGATGAGGSNYTGSFSSAAGATCQAGDPRTPGYWGSWNRCSGGNQWKTAERNGGAAAGFYLLEDVLPQIVGNLTVSTCPVGVSILNQQDLVTGQSKANDAAFGLARHLLAAEANFASWKKTCLAAQQVVTNGQALLVQVNFIGTGSYLSSGDALYQQARDIQTQLDAYNNGNLCK
jgi:uncharacterized repeat protein (TIGR01451 family)